MTKIFSDQENIEWRKTLPAKMSSACIAIRAGTNVLMVKAHYKDHWTFPSGIVDENESPRAAALRETHEEIGVTLSANDISLLTVVYSHNKNGHKDRFNFVFITDAQQGSLSLSLQEEEIERAEWVPIEKLAEYSHQKGSYVAIQQLLQNPSQPQPYVEVL